MKGNSKGGSKCKRMRTLARQGARTFRCLEKAALMLLFLEILHMKTASERVPQATQSKTITVGQHSYI